MFRQSARVNGQIELILYGALLYERRHIGAAVTHVHYIQANGSTVATVHRSGTSPDNTHRYLHKDHLGSVVAITSQAGVIEERLAYDAWGKRRPWNTWQTPNPGVFIAAITLTRGFTLHEHLDQVGLIHMGGRVYDPEIGRFLSADPFVQFPASTQGFNRYSYVANNPLSYTDPSGYFLKKVARIAGIAMYFVLGMQLSLQYPRFGYRRIHVMLARQVQVMSVDRAWRIWQQHGLQVPRKRLRRRVAASRPRPLPANGPNQVWAYDFVFDACANGQQLKCLTVIDEFTRGCLAIDVAGGIRSARVIEVLAKLVSLHGAPRYLRSDNGPEFVSRALLRWSHAADIDTAVIEPGKPWQNGSNESFNGKFRDECLAMEWFRNRVEAKVVIENWRQEYNAVRPHSSLGYLTPLEFKKSLTTTHPDEAIFQV